MTRREFAHAGSQDAPATDGRRRELRLLILSAADAARKSRRVAAFAERMEQSGRAVRERVSTLLRAAS